MGSPTAAHLLLRLVAVRTARAQKGEGMRILGATCTSSTAFFALMDDETYIDDDLRRIDVADILEEGERLLELRERLRVEIMRIQPDAVALMGSISKPRSYAVAAERATIETMIRFVAQELGIPCGRLQHPTIRARLDLPRTGQFNGHARTFFDEEHQPYWGERCEAAAVAVAWQRA